MAQDVVKENSVSSAFVIDKITEFFKMVKDGKYINKIDALEGANLILNYYDFFDYQQDNQVFSIFDFLNRNPEQFIHFCEISVKEIYSEKHGKEKAKLLDLTIQVDKSELEITVNQAIKNRHLNKLVTISALVNGESEIQNRIKLGSWVCAEGHKTISESEKSPLKCGNSKCTERRLDLDYESTKIESYRTFYLKDVNYTVHHGDTLIAEAKGDLSDIAKVGDIVQITGYITSQQKDKKLFNILHILNIEITNKIDYQITEEDKKIFEQWPKKDNFYPTLINSIAPQIYKNELLKEAFLLCYIGSSKWSADQKYWINVLAVGDPATAKSKIAQWGNRVLPNVSLVSSKAGSAKGLFAGQKEQIDGNKVLEVGPMVQNSGRGLVCIDEFARMSEVFDVFYSPMENGRFNSATVGGHSDLPAETPIYATGNPKKSNFWDENKSVLDNLQVFEPAMLSRFDLIMILKDFGTIEVDTKIAETILSQTTGDRAISYNEVDLAKYLMFCKTIHPKLTDDSKKIITQIFVDIRRQARGSLIDHQDLNVRLVGVITRISLAIARIHLHHEVKEEDVSLARRLLENMLHQRGLKVSNANTYVDRVAQKILTILESSISALTDQEIYEKLFITFEQEKDTLLNDIGTEGPHRDSNKRWRAIMENVEKSYLIEIESMKPKKLRYKHEQTRL